MTLSRALKKLLSIILCCKEDDVVDNIIRTGSAGYGKPASGIHVPSSGSEASFYTAKTHLTPQASVASYHTAKSSATSYHTAREGSAAMSRRSSANISRQSSGGRSSEQYSLGNISPRSSAAMSRASSAASDASDRNFWAARARQSSGIFGDSPEKKAHFKSVEMKFWNGNQKRNAWKTARSSAGTPSAARVGIPRGVSSIESKPLAWGSSSHRPGSRSTRSSVASSSTPLLSAWRSDSPMFI
jgi:hypothetical protein